jgi:LPS export ABC transporter protein LptC
MSFRNLLWLIPLSLILTKPFWQQPAAEFLKPRGGYDAAVEQMFTQERQDFIMEDVVLTFTNKGQQTWTVQAVQARTGKTDRDIDMSKVHAVYSKEGDDPITVTSQNGSYQMDDKHLTLTDDVILVKPVQHEELRSDVLHYYDLSKKLISPGKVIIDGPTFKLRGSKMDYDVSSKAYDFGGRVYVVM